MGHNPLFVAIFIEVAEERWFRQIQGMSTEEIDRVEKKYFLSSHLFAAPDRDHAYEKALNWISGFRDRNHDGSGDETCIYSIGIFDIIETTIVDPIEEKLNGLYGVNVGTIACNLITDGGVPQVKLKKDLSIYRWPPLEK